LAAVDDQSLHKGSAIAIRSFRHKGLEELFVDGRSRRVGQAYHKKLLILLDAVNGATDPKDLAAAHGFHALSGNLAGFYAMRVTGNWRLVFRFDESGHAVDVDFVDYH
jgi:proteic killer suppression protein